METRSFARVAPVPRLAEVTLAALAALAPACHESSTSANFTGINVFASFDGSLPIDLVEISGKLEDGTDAFVTGKVEIAPQAPPPPRGRASLVVLLGEELHGDLVHVGVEGKSNGAVLVSGSQDVRLDLGHIITASIALGAPSECGDGRVGSAESCDDGNNATGDGCSDGCAVERGFACALEPSRCADEATTVFVDAAAACNGDGSAARPFCIISDGINAPRAATVIVRRGLYSEQAVFDRLRVDVLAESGAVLESELSPALHVGGNSIVEITGLVVRGKNNAGGGVLVEGRGTNVELSEVELGPSSAIGVELAGDASLALLRSVVRGNSGGGVKLGGTGTYRLENDVIAENGTATSTIGGVAIDSASAGARFVNVTVANNAAAAGTGAAGIKCAVEASIANTIVWANAGGPAIDSDRCLATHSDLGPDVDRPPSGSNFSMDPLLAPDYRLLESSPCKDRGDPTGIEPAGVAPGVDIDGEPRPKGERVDVGADEAG